MSMFRKDPAAAIAKARADLAKHEQVIAEHKIKRGQLLLDADDVAAIAQVDTALAVNERALIIQKERIAALTDEMHRQDVARRAERQSAISATITPKLAKIEGLATAAEQSLAKFFDSYSKLQTAVREINGVDWPASVPRPPHAYYFSIDEVSRRLSTALDRAARHGVKEGASIATDIAESVQHSSARWLGALRATPLPDAAPADEEAA